MRIKEFLFLKNVFYPDYEVFWQKNQETMNVGKIRNYDEEKLLFREKTFFFCVNAFFTKMSRRKICRWYSAVLFSKSAKVQNFNKLNEDIEK